MTGPGAPPDSQNGAPGPGQPRRYGGVSGRTALLAGTVAGALLILTAFRTSAEPNSATEIARQLGLDRVLIDERLTLDDIASNRQGPGKLYHGAPWSRTLPAPRLFRQARDGICMDLDGFLSNASAQSMPGLPLLPGSADFYIEFTARTTSNDQDHWPALYLMPIEHDAKLSDHYPQDPPRYQRFVELDIDEGGFGPGAHGVAISWEGIWPNYKRTYSKGGKSSVPLDRTKPHRFGLSYQAREQRVYWWLDGVRQHSAGPPYVAAVARRQNFFFIMHAHSHGKRKPYQMCVSRIRAFVRKGR